MVANFEVSVKGLGAGCVPGFSRMREIRRVRGLGRIREIHHGGFLSQTRPGEESMDLPNRHGGCIMLRRDGEPMSLERRVFGFLLFLPLFCLACSSAPSRGTARQVETPTFPGLLCDDVAEMRFYFTGDAFLERAEELIRDARDYILIDSFLAIEDEKGERVIELLRRKMNDHVRVYVVTDSSSAYVHGRTAVPYMVERGIPVVEYNPIRSNRAARLPLCLYRDHRKYWLIDGRTIILGGQNISSTSLNAPEEYGHTDSMVEFRSEQAFRELLLSFVREWNAYSTCKLTEEEFPVRARPYTGLELYLVHQDGFWNAVVDDLFFGLMDRAEREIWLVQSYTIPTRSMLERIRRLTARGVVVNILYSSYNFHEKFHYAPGYRMTDLIEAGAQLWQYENPSSHLHYKAMIVDRRWFTLGSANLNFRSFYLSKELNILFEGAGTGAELLDNLDALKSHASRIDRGRAAGYRSPKYLFYYLLLYLGG
jgi:cardiolipin synthase